MPLSASLAVHQETGNEHVSGCVAARIVPLAGVFFGCNIEYTGRGRAQSEL